jgi:DNA-binding response OmpR family regulator
MRILIIGTELEINEEVRLALCDSQLELDISISNIDFLEIINRCPDLLIMNMDSSDLACLELLSKIRDDSDIPVVVLSRDGTVETIIKAFDAGANDFIVYPFNKNILVARLGALVRRRNWDIKAKENKVREVAKQHNEQSNIATSLIVSKI